MLSMTHRRDRSAAGLRLVAFLTGFTLLVAPIACTNSDPTVAVTTDPLSSVSPCKPVTCVAPIPAWYGAFGPSVSVSRAGDTIILKSDGVPDHKSPYFPPRDPRYEAYTGPNPKFKLNPNRIAAQSFTFRIPMNPATTTTPVATSLGPIGVAVNGVPLYNQYAAAWAPVTDESDTFDQYNGHPQGDDIYHYHWEPLWLTRTSKEALIGVLLDGFPVYGPQEGGRIVASSSLDSLTHGHFGVTAEFPLGIFHYHTTRAAPYINGGVFAGTPGTVTY